MHRPRRALRGLALGFVAALAVAACARDAQDWKAATAADTPEARNSTPRAPLFHSGLAPSELSRMPVYTPSATPSTMLPMPITRTMSRLA